MAFTEDWIDVKFLIQSTNDRPAYEGWLPRFIEVFPLEIALLPFAIPVSCDCEAAGRDGEDGADD